MNQAIPQHVDEAHELGSFPGDNPAQAVAVDKLGRVIENQQPLVRERSEQSMHRHHRISDINDITGAELGRQLAEPVSQHRRILGGELPGYPDLGQVTVRIRQRHAGLPCSSKSAQGHRPRPWTIAAS